MSVYDPNYVDPIAICADGTLPDPITGICWYGQPGQAPHPVATPPVTQPVAPRVTLPSLPTVPTQQNLGMYLMIGAAALLTLIALQPQGR